MQDGQSVFSIGDYDEQINRKLSPARMTGGGDGIVSAYEDSQDEIIELITAVYYDVNWWKPVLTDLMKTAEDNNAVLDFDCEPYGLPELSLSISKENSTLTIPMFMNLIRSSLGYHMVFSSDHEFLKITGFNTMKLNFNGDDMATMMNISFENVVRPIIENLMKAEFVESSGQLAYNEP